MNVLTIENLHKSFKKKNVLCGLNLTVPEHSVFGFVGRNGTGKTTTMKAVLGLLKPDEGEIRVCGEKVNFGQTATNRYIGYLPDVPAFYPFMTPKEYLVLCGESLGMSREKLEAKSEELLRLVGLSEENRKIKGFSRGMKQRLGIAQALMPEPKLLICDEPTSALDPIGRKEILDILMSVKDQTTVMFSTHILSDVERICTDVAILNNGAVAMQGSVEQLKQANRTKEFIVEMQDQRGLSMVSNAFMVPVTADNLLVFTGGEEQMFAVLGFIKDNRLPVKKIERSLSSLESLFVEVVR